MELMKGLELKSSEELLLRKLSFHVKERKFRGLFTRYNCPKAGCGRQGLVFFPLVASNETREQPQAVPGMFKFHTSRNFFTEKLPKEVVE